MSVLVNDDNYPNTALVYIEADFGFSTYSGSGFIVGPNDIITAAHIPYSSSLKRLADEIRVYPSFDPQTPYNNYYLYANRVEYFPNFDPDGDGRIYIGDYKLPTFIGTEIDIALLTIDLSAVGDQNLESAYGSFGIDANFIQGEVNVLGYPSVYGYNPILDTGTAIKSSLDRTYILQDDLEVNPGNSGGPIYYTGSDGLPYAVGLVSTAISATSLQGHWQEWLAASIKENDVVLNLPPVYSITADKRTINEGDSVTFSIQTENVSEGTLVNYQITGVDDDDLDSGQLSGSVRINSSGTGQISLETKTDFKTEGQETIVARVKNKGVAVVLEDTSQTVPNFSADINMYFSGTTYKDFLLADSDAPVNHDTLIDYFHGETIGAVENENYVVVWKGENIKYYEDEMATYYSGKATLGDVFHFLVRLGEEFIYPKEGNLNTLAISKSDMETILFSVWGEVNIESVISNKLSFESLLNEIVFSENGFVGKNNQVYVHGGDTNDYLPFIKNSFHNGGSGEDTLEINFLPYTNEVKFKDINLSEGSGSVFDGTSWASFSSIEKIHNKIDSSTQSLSTVIDDYFLANNISEISLQNTSVNEIIDAGLRKIIFIDDEYAYSQVSKNANDWTVNSESYGRDTLIGFERVQFSDGTLALDIDGGDTAGQAYRLYQAAFARTPDMPGVAYHMNDMESNGLSVTQIAGNFIASPEFKAQYGENPTEDEYINLLYQNVLGRTPQQFEVDYYKDRFDQGTTDWNTTLVFFAESPENVALVAPDLVNGVWLPDPF